MIFEETTKNFKVTVGVRQLNQESIYIVYNISDITNINMNKSDYSYTVVTLLLWSPIL